MKFRALGITAPLGLGIERLVFHALNTTEITLAAVLLAAPLTYRPGIAGWLSCSALPELCWPPRPGCCGPDWTDVPGRSSPGRPPRLHLAYIALEIVKVAALVALGTLLNTDP